MWKELTFPLSLTAASRALAGAFSIRATAKKTFIFAFTTLREEVETRKIGRNET
jgi:hypothetical protein